MNILAFFAHPDDETMLCGGTLALLAQNGASVHYLCATRGEGGELGEVIDAQIIQNALDLGSYTADALQIVLFALRCA